MGTNTIRELKIGRQSIIQLTYFLIWSCGYWVIRDLVILGHARRGSRRDFQSSVKNGVLKLVSHIAVSETGSRDLTSLWEHDQAENIQARSHDWKERILRIIDPRHLGVITPHCAYGTLAQSLAPISEIAAEWEPCNPWRCCPMFRSSL